MTEQQRRCISKVGFGAIYRIRLQHLDMTVVGRLLENFDTKSRTLQFNGTKIELNVRLVHSVFGIPSSGNLKPTTAGGGFEKFKAEFTKGENQVIGFQDLYAKVQGCKSDGHNFIVFYLMLIFTGILFPKYTDKNVPTQYLDYLTDPEAIDSYNWSEIVLNDLVTGITTLKNKRNKYVTGCILLLEVVFLNSVALSFPHLGKAIVPSFPTVEQWEQDEATKAISCFMQSSGSKFESDVAQELEQPSKIDSAITINSSDMMDQLKTLNQAVSKLLFLLLERLPSTPSPQTNLSKPYPNKVRDHEPEAPNTGDSGVDDVQPKVEKQTCDIQPRSLNFDNETYDNKTLTENTNSSNNIMEMLRNEFTIFETSLEYLWDERLNDKKTLARYDEWLMERKDFKSLENPNWITNGVIDFVAIHIWNSNPGTYEDITNWVLPGWFCAMAKRSDNLALGYVFKDNGIFRGPNGKCEKIKVPMNCDDHWYLCVIDLRVGKIIICDSLEGPSTTTSRKEAAILVVQRLEEIAARWGTFRRTNWATTFEWVVDKKTPRQPNGHDCGVYVCMQMLFPGSFNRPLTLRESIETRKRISCGIYNSFDNEVPQGHAFWVHVEFDFYDDISLCIRTKDIDAEENFEAIREHRPQDESNDILPAVIGNDADDENSVVVLDSNEALENYIKNRIQNHKISASLVVHQFVEN